MGAKHSSHMPFPKAFSDELMVRESRLRQKFEEFRLAGSDDWSDFLTYISKDAKNDPRFLNFVQESSRFRVVQQYYRYDAESENHSSRKRKRDEGDVEPQAPALEKDSNKEDIDIQMKSRPRRSRKSRKRKRDEKGHSSEEDEGDDIKVEPQSAASDLKEKDSNKEDDIQMKSRPRRSRRSRKRRSRKHRFVHHTDRSKQSFTKSYLFPQSRAWGQEPVRYDNIENNLQGLIDHINSYRMGLDRYCSRRQEIIRNFVLLSFHDDQGGHANLLMFEIVCSTGKVRAVLFEPHNTPYRAALPFLRALEQVGGIQTKYVLAGIQSGGAGGTCKIVTLFMLYYIVNNWGLDFTKLVDLTELSYALKRDVLKRDDKLGHLNVMLVFAFWLYRELRDVTHISKGKHFPDTNCDNQWPCTLPCETFPGTRECYLPPPSMRKYFTGDEQPRQKFIGK